MDGSLSGSLASMLASMPYAVSAKFAHPGRPVVCTIGDAAFQMRGMNELLTVKRHCRAGEDPRRILLVPHNRDLTQVPWEMRAAGDPRDDTIREGEGRGYAAFADVLGLTGIRVDSKDEVAGAWDRAFAADRPVVLDVRTDPDTPPLPPHISLDEAKGMAASLAKGDPAEGSVISQSARGMAAALFTK